MIIIPEELRPHERKRLRMITMRERISALKEDGYSPSGIASRLGLSSVRALYQLEQEIADYFRSKEDLSV